VHKVGVACKEVRETLFWLELVRSSQRIEGAARPSIEEADELVAILIAPARTARSKG
jgi:hypothetical protein